MENLGFFNEQASSSLMGRFRFTANLTRRYNLEKAAIRELLAIQAAALKFLDGVQPSDYVVPQEVKAAGFDICGDELGSLVEGRDLNKLKYHGGVDGIADKLSSSTTTGLATEGDLLNRRQEVFGVNKFAESQQCWFWVYVWEALQDLTLMILGVCAFVSLIVGLATEGWPKGAHDGLGIVVGMLLVVFVMAISDYRQSLQFRDLDKEKKKILIQVTRDGCQQKMSIYELLPGDIVHLAIGDQVPADGLFVSGFSVVIDEPSLTEESEPVMVTAENPFLLSGTKVQDGACKMMITTVGMRTRRGKLMETLSEGGDDETSLQVKLNGVATIIGKIGLFFAGLVKNPRPRRWIRFTAPFSEPHEAATMRGSNQLLPVWPGLNFWYYLAIISSPSWIFSILALKFIKKTTGLVSIFLTSTLSLSWYACNFVLSKLYFSETSHFFHGYERVGKTVSFTLQLFGNVGLYYFSEKSVAFMLTFIFIAFYCVCGLFCIQPYTDFGALDFLLSACLNQTLSLFGLHSLKSWLVMIVCIVIAGIRHCLEPVHPPRSEEDSFEVQLESGLLHHPPVSEEDGLEVQLESGQLHPPVSEPVSVEDSLEVQLESGQCENLIKQ